MNRSGFHSEATVDFLLQIFSLLFVSPIVNRYLCALGGEGKAHGTAQTVRSACNQGHFVPQVKIHGCYPSFRMFCPLWCFCIS